MKYCKICESEIAEGVYENLNVCPICGDVLGDVVVCFFDVVARNCLKEVTKEDVPAILRKLRDNLDWVESISYLHDMKSDNRYFERFRDVLDWLEKGEDKDLSKEVFKCRVCGSNLMERCVGVERSGSWVRFYCKECEHIVSRHYIPSTNVPI